MYLGKMAPDFTNVWNDDKWFPTQKITDFEKWRQFNTYRDILKPGEDFDILGNKKQFRLNDSFTIVFLMTYYSDEQVLKAYKNVPNADKM